MWQYTVMTKGKPCEVYICVHIKDHISLCNADGIKAATGRLSWHSGLNVLVDMAVITISGRSLNLGGQSNSTICMYEVPKELHGVP